MSEWGRVIEAAEEDIARRAQEANWLRGRLRAAEWEAVERSRRITFLEAKLAEVEEARAATLSLERQITARGGEVPAGTPAPGTARPSQSVDSVSQAEWRSRCERAQQELEMRAVYLEDKEAFWEEEMRKLEAQVERHEAELATSRLHLGEFGRSQGEGDVAAHERQAAALRERAQFKQRLKEVTIERDAARKSTSDLVQRLAAAEEARGHLQEDVVTFQQGLAQILWEGGLHKGEGTAAEVVGLVQTMVEGLKAEVSLSKVSPLPPAARAAGLRESALINELQSTYREADKLLQDLDKPVGGRPAQRAPEPRRRAESESASAAPGEAHRVGPARGAPAEGAKRPVSVSFAEEEPKIHPRPEVAGGGAPPKGGAPSAKETPLRAPTGAKALARAGVGAPADDTPAPATSKAGEALKPRPSKAAGGESTAPPQVPPPSRMPPPAHAPPPSRAPPPASAEVEAVPGPSHPAVEASGALLAAAAVSLEENVSVGPGITDFQVYGPLTLGSMLRACGRPVNGTSMCHFQWQRADFKGGEFYDIIDAVSPDYSLSADDVGRILRVVCTPVLESGESGSVVVGEVSKGDEVLDESAEAIIDEFMAKGAAAFDVRIAGSDSPEVATLSVDRKLLTILRPNRSVLLKETLATAQPRFQLHPESPLACKIEIHGQPTHIKFEDARLRDIAVLTARQFTDNAKKEKSKAKSFFFGGRNK